jgi:glycosyltransferase involved in cell wall biosynthesis
MEAASHGCVCVASCRYGGLCEFIKDGRTGFLLNQHDPERLAGALIQIATAPAMALEIRRQAVALLQQEFSTEKALRFYENYFQSRPV